LNVHRDARARAHRAATEAVRSITIKVPLVAYMVPFPTIMANPVSIHDQFELDVEIAVRGARSTLLTAPANQIEAIVRRIADRADRRVIYVPVGPSVPERAFVSAVGAGHDRAIIWLAHVNDLTDAQQQLLGMRLLDSVPRVIATTDRNLYELVLLRQVDATLFYRLNVIHLVHPDMRRRVGDEALV